MEILEPYFSLRLFLVRSVPTLEASIDRTGVPPRILDISPFNGFPLTCMATSRVAGEATAIRKQITWTRSVNDGPPEQLTDGTNVDSVVMVMEDSLFGATSMSMLMVNTTMSGSHSYTCRAELVVAPAPDSISTQTQTTINIVGELKIVIIITTCDVCRHNYNLHYLVL